MIEQPTAEEKKNLLTNEELHQWDKLVKNIEALYDVDQIWSKGFWDWVYEYKFRQGGKTLCTLYMKKDMANILITLGKAERDKYDSIRNTFSDEMNELYDTTESFHDGKWLWIPSDYDWSDIHHLLVTVQYLHSYDAKIHENRLRRWDFCTSESFSYGLRGSATTCSE